jgi:hypothetical protein
MIIFLFIYLFFIQKLLKFQAYSMAGKWLTKNTTAASVYLIDEKSNAFNFLSKTHIIKPLALMQLMP